MASSSPSKAVSLQPQPLLSLSSSSLTLHYLHSIVAKILTEHNPSFTKDSFRLFTFGSHRLGVASESSDLDILCIGPSELSASEFYRLLFEFMVHWNKDECHSLEWISNAFVPLCTMHFRGTEVDLLYLPLPQTKVTESMLLDDEWLDWSSMQDSDAVMLNGFRASETLRLRIEALGSVRRDLCRQCILQVKKWARIRGVYGNRFGYFGGINLAIMCLIVFESVNLTPFTNDLHSAICAFFMYWNSWNWKEGTVIAMLGTDVHQRPKCCLTDSLSAMLRRNAKRTPRVNMPVPCFPYTNTAHTFTEVSVQTIVLELKRASNISETFMFSPDRKMTGIDFIQTLCGPDALYESLSSKSIYKNFLLLQSEDKYIRRGMLESKLSRLADSIAQCPEIAVLRTFPEPLCHPSLSLQLHASPEAYFFVIAFSTHKNVKQLNLSSILQSFKLMILDKKEDGPEFKDPSPDSEKEDVRSVDSGILFHIFNHSKMKELYLSFAKE